MPTIYVTVFNSNEPVLNLDHQTQIKLGIDKKDISVRAGSALANLHLENRFEENCISSAALDLLSLPILPDYSLRFDGHQASISPIIGIFTSRSKKRSKPPYTSQNYLLRKFLNYCCEKRYVAFVFSPVGLDQANQKIKGYYLITDKEGQTQWKEHLFPLPEVVYDRILHRSFEQLTSTIAAKSYLSDKEIPYFNPKFLNKWGTHKILVQNELLRQHLPETALFTEISSLQSFLNKYGTVYLKPIHGSLGKGILKVTSNSGDFICQYRKKKKVLTETYPSYESLFQAVQNYKGKKSYIIQQGLNMLKYHETVFDIRVLTQKNGTGKWGITAEVARLASRGSIFPNIAAGGEAKNITEVWAELTNNDWQQSKIKQVVEQICLESARALEQSIGLLGEIGLDIGVDIEGHVWIIEINSKPSRKVFAKDQLALKKISIQLPMDFAAYLVETKEDRSN